MASVGFGLALYMTGGTPVYGMPVEFGDTFGFGSILGVPAPVLVTVILIAILYFVVNWTRLGRYFYAVGGNVEAARLSGIDTRLTLFLAYVLCGAMAAVAGILLTARLDTGEANIGATMPLESIAACVIAGVSLRGGIGRIENVVLGALYYADPDNGDDGSLIITREYDPIDPATAAERCLRAIEEGVTESVNGVTVEVGSDCICVHSDTPNAIEVARAVRRAIRPHLDTEAVLKTRIVGGFILP